MPATSTTLFPEGFYPTLYAAEPMSGQVVSADADNGAEQVSLRRSYPLLSFLWRSEPLSVTDAATFRAFIRDVGSGFVNFTFYEPESKYYSGDWSLGTTDGTVNLVIPFRNLNAQTSIKVNGSTDSGATVSHEYVSATKEDRVTFTPTPGTGLPVTAANFYARQRYICRMLSWREYQYAEGLAQRAGSDPLTSFPLHLRVFELRFREKR